MAVKHIVELFALDGRDFITEAYRNLLKREPDEDGLMYYIGRLAQGNSKDTVIAQLAESPECRPLNEIAGLEKITVDAQRSKNWFWRWFSRPGHLERAVYSGTSRIDAQFTRTNQHLASLQEALQIAAKDHAQQMEVLIHQVAQMQITSPYLDQLQDNPQQLSLKIVEQAFMDILGRSPEGAGELNHHAKSESRQALREALILSDEFQARVSALPEYARSILQCQIQMAKLTLENNSCVC
ncbi:DUF4214 domain-containing protein [Acidithiobacillus sp. 'AMD consortium']|uniref:DUF4214 domain-containing protein n=1 Tax=Acidithiobacillus sp. 'AMD consortium' TaxID=2614801 RepID=UPI00124F2D64|nr:DUF4214 domain-containing protein [Acidithiobacillus sp. 'AMD consortium']QFG79584.1 DUF4214 domain-containing protein [Acidithiobacillus sp. 'AMD consortium']